METVIANITFTYYNSHVENLTGEKMKVMTANIKAGSINSYYSYAMRQLDKSNKKVKCLRIQNVIKYLK